MAEKELSNVEITHLIQELKCLEAEGAPKKEREEIFNKIPTEFKVTVCLGCGKRYEDSDCGCPAGSAENLRNENEIAELLQQREKEMDKEIIHDYFGLSYANYLVLPRSVLQSMPDEWQEEFVELLNQIPGILGTEFEPEGGYDVRARDEEGRFTKDPFSNYERGRRRLKLKAKKF